MVVSVEADAHGVGFAEEHDAFVGAADVFADDGGEGAQQADGGLVVAGIAGAVEGEGIAQKFFGVVVGAGLVLGEGEDALEAGGVVVVGQGGCEVVVGAGGQGNAQKTEGPLGGGAAPLFLIGVGIVFVLYAIMHKRLSSVKGLIITLKKAL